MFDLIICIHTHLSNRKQTSVVSIALHYNHTLNGLAKTNLRHPLHQVKAASQCFKIPNGSL